eukprot:tig00000139_g8293.t1
MPGALERWRGVVITKVMAASWFATQMSFPTARCRLYFALSVRLLFAALEELEWYLTRELGLPTRVLDDQDWAAMDREKERLRKRCLECWPSTAATRAGARSLPGQHRLPEDEDQFVERAMPELMGGARAHAVETWATLRGSPDGAENLRLSLLEELTRAVWRSVSALARQDPKVPRPGRGGKQRGGTPEARPASRQSVDAGGARPGTAGTAISTEDGSAEAEEADGFPPGGPLDARIAASFATGVSFRPRRARAEEVVVVRSGAESDRDAASVSASESSPPKSARGPRARFQPPPLLLEALRNSPSIRRSLKIGSQRTLAAIASAARSARGASALTSAARFRFDEDMLAVIFGEAAAALELSQRRKRERRRHERVSAASRAPAKAEEEEEGNEGGAPHLRVPAAAAARLCAAIAGLPPASDPAHPKNRVPERPPPVPGPATQPRAAIHTTVAPFAAPADPQPLATHPRSLSRALSAPGLALYPSASAAALHRLPSHPYPAHPAQPSAPPRALAPAASAPSLSHAVYPGTGSLAAAARRRSSLLQARPPSPATAGPSGVPSGPPRPHLATVHTSAFSNRPPSAADAAAAAAAAAFALATAAGPRPASPAAAALAALSGRTTSRPPSAAAAAAAAAAAGGRPATPASAHSSRSFGSRPTSAAASASAVVAGAGAGAPRPASPAATVASARGPAVGRRSGQGWSQPLGAVLFASDAAGRAASPPPSAGPPAARGPAWSWDDGDPDAWEEESWADRSHRPASAAAAAEARSPAVKAGRPRSGPPAPLRASAGGGAGAIVALRTSEGVVVGVSAGVPLHATPGESLPWPGVPGPGFGPSRSPSSSPPR